MAPLNFRTLSLLVLPPMMWAGNAVVGRMLVGAMPPVAMNALRWAIVLVLLAPLAWRVCAAPQRIVSRWPYLALIGMLGVGTYNALQYLALQTSSPINVTLIGASIPVWMMLVGRLGFGQRLQPRQLAGAALSAAGVVLVLAQGQWAALMQVRLVPGDLLMLLASLAWALYSWLLAQPPAHMRGTERPSWDWAEFLWVQVLFGLAWAVGCSALEFAWEPHPLASLWPQDASTWAGLLFIAIGPSILAYRCWGLGVQAVGPTLAAFFINLTPVFAALWSALFLGQWPRWYHPCALLLITAGIAVSSGLFKNADGPGHRAAN
ncbi:DMT family transporter [Aquabacterium sp.]|uniref:DMT family transporter n=1 Tax=Aquabacterium sp. TaxID=1872578 RepID=UPI0035C6873F